MTLLRIPTSPIAGMKPGTSGLRKKVTEFAQGKYLANFVQSVFNAVRPAEGFGGLTLVIGGDGRYYNREAMQIAIRMAAANGFGRVLVGAGGLLSTPAASNVIRKYKAFGGIILSASHNPGGPDGDFGIKYNAANGGPAPEKITDAIYAETLKIAEYRILDTPDLDLGTLGSFRVGEMTSRGDRPRRRLRRADGELFDFDALRAMFAGGLRMTFDAMHAVTGPYAHAIFERELGAPAGTVRNGTPLPDFGGHHPDPNLVHAKELLRPDDGAGRARLRRRLGRRRRPQPHHRPRHLHHAVGLARDAGRERASRARLSPAASPASRVRCRPAPPSTGSRRSSACPASRRRRAGSSSATCSTPASSRSAARRAPAPASNHVREKDGLWAVLLWLNILAARRQSVAEIAREHWATYGRNYYARHDYEGIDTARRRR